VAVHTRRPHRLDRIAGLRYHHKLILSVLIVFAILALIVLLAKDRENIMLESAYGAADPQFPAYLAALAGAEPTSGNTFEVLQNGDVFFPSMLRAIADARRRIDFETYIYEKGEAGDRFSVALEAAATRGVEVNLVVDAVGSKKMSSDDVQRLTRAGVRIGTFGMPRWFKLQQANTPQGAGRRRPRCVHRRRRRRGSLAGSRTGRRSLARHDGAHRGAAGAAARRSVHRQLREHARPHPPGSGPAA
jgi:hypothetical protein